MTIKELKAAIDKLPENEQIYVIDADTSWLLPVQGITTRKINKSDSIGVLCIFTAGYDDCVITEY
jgi:hypothetical protein